MLNQTLAGIWQEGQVFIWDKNSAMEYSFLFEKLCPRLAEVPEGVGGGVEKKKRELKRHRKLEIRLQLYNLNLQWRKTVRNHSFSTNKKISSHLTLNRTVN